MFNNPQFLHFEQAYVCIPDIYKFVHTLPFMIELTLLFFICEYFELYF